MNRMKREGLATCTLLVLFCRGSGVLSSEDAGRQFPQKGSAGRGNFTHQETETSPDMEHFAGSFNMPMDSNESRGPSNLSNEATVLLEEPANEDNGKPDELDALDAQMDALDKKILELLELRELASLGPSVWANELCERGSNRLTNLLTDRTTPKPEQLPLRFQLAVQSEGTLAVETLYNEDQIELTLEYRERLEELKELKEHLKDLKAPLPLEKQMQVEKRMQEATPYIEDIPQMHAQLEHGQFMRGQLVYAQLYARLYAQSLYAQSQSRGSLPKSFGGRKGIANSMQIVAPLAMSIILITAFFELFLAERKRRASKQIIAGKA